ncbi:MAG: DUF3179 domain-containing protein [Patescibacteria group bacterium]
MFGLQRRWSIILLIIIILVFWYGQYWYYRISPTKDTVTQTETSSIVSKLSLSNVGKDSMPSIDNPVFENVWQADQYLAEDGYGLDVSVGSTHRFYPFQILAWHEIVNDTFYGKSLVITFSPLCFSGMVFERYVNNEIVDFGTSEKLLENNLVIYDRQTGSLWSQLLGRAISGDLEGRKLEQYPARTMTWAQWKIQYPLGAVLSRSTGAERDYSIDPYSAYYQNNDVMFLTSHKDARKRSKEKIIGSWTDEGAVAQDFDFEEFPEFHTPAFWFCWSAIFPKTKIK